MKGKQVKVSDETLERLMEVGFTAAWRGYWKQARAIFAAVQGVKPNNEGPLVGYGLSLINSDKNKLAVEQLRRALEMNPDNDVARCYLGMALKSAGLESEAARYFEGVIGADRDEAAVKLSRIMLGLEQEGASAV